MAVSAEDKIVRGGDLATVGAQVKAKLAEKQDTLVSGTSIKTINNTSLLGSGDIVISDGQDGASAYELWLSAGNTGSMADFLASLQGNSGYQGEAGELEVVNNLTDGGATSALSAEMGKQLKTQLYGLPQKQITFQATGSMRSLSATINEGDIISSITGGVSYVDFYETASSSDKTRVQVSSLPYTAESQFKAATAYVSGSPTVTITIAKVAGDIDVLNASVGEMQTTVSTLNDNYTDISDNIDSIENELTITEWSPIQNPISTLNAYAYKSGSGGLVFFTNQYTSNYYYALYELQAGSTYRLTLNRSLESRSLFAGYIDSESDFVVGGSISEAVLTESNYGSPVVITPEEDKYLVVLYHKTKGLSYYVTSEQVSSETSVKDLVISLSETIDIPSYTLCCPDVFYAVVGKELNVYYDTLHNAGPDYYLDIQCPDLQNGSNKIAVRRERMWQIDGTKLTSSYIGSHQMKINLFDNSGKVIASKTATLSVSAQPQLSSTKNILCIGDSLINNGPIVSTFASNFSSQGVQPTFIGSRITDGYRHEGYPGYTFSSFTSSGSSNAYFIFDIPDGTSVSIDDIYSTNSSNYTIKDIRTEGLDNAIRIRCTRSGSTTPTSTGTLTKVSGASSSASSINYSAFEAETGNPFWNSSSSKVDFGYYRNKMSMGSSKFDLVIILLGVNDAIGNYKSDSAISSTVANAKILIDAVLEDADSYGTKIILQLVPQDANSISSWQVYADSTSYSRKMAYKYNVWKLREALYNAFSDSYPDVVYLGQAVYGIDRIYGYPYTTIQSSSRINIEEMYHTNSVHPNTNGYRQIGDGFYLQTAAIL